MMGFDYKQSSKKFRAVWDKKKENKKKWNLNDSDLRELERMPNERFLTEDGT